LHRRAFVWAALILACPAYVSVAQVAGSGGASPVKFPEVPGFVLTTEAKVYEPSNLWDFIDGAADLFVSYGFVDLHIAYYHSRSGVEIRAEVYRHDAPENAFGMYSQERSPGNNFVKVGTQGYAEEGIFNFFAGHYYVKLSSNQTGDAVHDSLQTVAWRLETALVQPAVWPSALALLPAEARVPNSEQYIAQSYLGYTFLHGAYTAQYRTNELFEIFVIPTTSDSIAASMCSALASVNHFTPSSGSLSVIPDPHQGEIALVVKGRYLGGVVHCKDTSARSKFVKILQSALR
jgi:hypothetical protein